MSEFFKNIPKIKYEGSSSDNPLSFKHYNENKIVLGKSMKEQLRFATCYWHTFTWPGTDPFGGPTLDRPWMRSDNAIKMAELNYDIANKKVTIKKTNSLTEKVKNEYRSTESNLI